MVEPESLGSIEIISESDFVLIKGQAVLSPFLLFLPDSKKKEIARE